MTTRFQIASRISCVAWLACACSGNMSLGDKVLSNQGGTSGTGLGGTNATGMGGTLAAGGASWTGGTSFFGSGGTESSGGTTGSAGGTPATTGGVSTGGVEATGGGANTGGSAATGGTAGNSGTTSTKLVAKTVAAGVQHTCAMRTDGTVQCWGDNDFSQLGNGTQSQSSVPVTVSGITNARAVAAGDHHTCAMLTDGAVQCWGDNNSGQLGNNTTDTCLDTAEPHPNDVSCTAPPVTVLGITNATTLTAGGYHTCAVLGDGTVRCWGSNDYGELGDGTKTNRSVPVSVSGITNATAVAAGNDHTCAVLSSGKVQCWGYNDSGQLGNSTTETCFISSPWPTQYSCSATPVIVSGITNASAVAAGDRHTCAMLADGTVQCWGNNDYGELGNIVPDTCRVGMGVEGYSASCSVTPVTVSGITNATIVSAGDGHTCAVVNGGAQCWGENGTGELGNSTTETCLVGPDTYAINVSCSATPVTVLGITNTAVVTAGGGHTCAVLSPGTVQCWGHNDSGQLGNNSKIDSLMPVQVQLP